MLHRLFFTALLAGLVAGIVLASVQALRAIPLIHEAEVYETAAAHPSRRPSGPPQDEVIGKQAAPTETHKGPAEAGVERYAFTLLADLLAAIGFALLLVAGYAFFGVTAWPKGLLWGLGGFLAFALAPSLGLPPELPGTEAAALPLRQLWWIMTASGTAAGLLLIAFARHWLWKALGAALLALPHLIGAPQPEHAAMVAPAALAESFVTASLAANLVFWLVLGPLAAWLFEKLVQPAIERG